MAKHITDSIVVHCIDFRFQEYLDGWLSENLGHGNYDRVSYAGSVLDFDTVFEQIKISERLHEIKQVILINHEDCGAYGAEGTYERHQKDLLAAKEKVLGSFPHLNVSLLYLRLDGRFEKVA